MALAYTITAPRWGAVFFENVAHPKSCTRAVRLFNAAVRGEGEPAADSEDGVRSLQIALAVRESAMTGKRITLE